MHRVLMNFFADFAHGIPHALHAVIAHFSKRRIAVRVRRKPAGLRNLPIRVHVHVLKRHTTPPGCAEQLVASDRWRGGKHEFEYRNSKQARISKSETRASASVLNIRISCLSEAAAHQTP